MLKAGTETGSLTNHILSYAQDAEPEIGMGVTKLGWTDRHPYEIVGILRSKKGLIKAIQIRGLQARALHKGMTDAQSWELTPNPGGLVLEARRCTRGRHKGRYLLAGSPLLIGRAEMYYDYSF